MLVLALAILEGNMLALRAGTRTVDTALVALAVLVSVQVVAAGAVATVAVSAAEGAALLALSRGGTTAARQAATQLLELALVQALAQVQVLVLVQTVVSESASGQSGDAATEASVQARGQQLLPAQTMKAALEGGRAIGMRSMLAMATKGETGTSVLVAVKTGMNAAAAGDTETRTAAATATARMTRQLPQAQLLAAKANLTSSGACDGGRLQEAQARRQMTTTDESADVAMMAFFESTSRHACIYVMRLALALIRSVKQDSILGKFTQIPISHYPMH